MQSLFKQHSLWSMLIVALLLFVGLFISLLAFSAPLVWQMVPKRDLELVNVQPGHTIGQTFVAPYDGLSAVDVFLQPHTTGVASITLRLRNDPQDEQDRVVTMLSTAEVVEPSFYRFNFPPLSDSGTQAYYMLIEYTGEGWVQAGRAPGADYIEGAAYHDGQPENAQLLFRLGFAPLPMMIGAIYRALTAVPLVGGGLLLYLLPGWALLMLFWPTWAVLTWGEKLGLASGVSLALYPLLLLGGETVGLRPGALYVWLPLLAALVALVWQTLKGRPKKALNSLPNVSHSANAFWPDLTLLILLLLIVGTRLSAIRLVAVPLWGDSYHHTMIAQLILDNRGLFNSWEPYVPYQSLTVQYGFSSAVAALSWLTGANSWSATLIAGQLINVLAVVALYPLALRISGGRRWAGVGAVLVAGLLSPAPGMYVNWGRYAQLAGQAILPATLVLTWETLETGLSNDEPQPLSVQLAQPTARRQAVLLSLLTGATLVGMLLTYYRMAFYYAGFMLALTVGWAALVWGRNLRLWLTGGIRLTLIALVACLLLIPWVRHVIDGKLAQSVVTGVATQTVLESVLADYLSWANVTYYLPAWLIGLVLAGLLWSLVQRRWMVSTMALWVLALALIVAGRLLRLPGANLMQSFAVMIALYLPAGIVVGWLIAELLERSGRLGNVGRLMASLVLIGAASWGATAQLVILDPTYVLVTRPDLRAMDWIRAHTPPDAHFLVEGFSIYRKTSAVGADAGWWIPLLAGRQNTMPPQYALMSEAPQPPDYSDRVVRLTTDLEKTSLATPAGMQLLCEHQITHIYLGQGQGLVGAGVSQLFALDQLVSNPALEQIYRRDRVAIFALRPGACGATK